ncbi:MAG: rhomboid family intramembrane serine protease [Gammaproteobacteria bacterium]
MENLTFQLDLIVNAIQQNLWFMLGIILVFCVIHLINQLVGKRLNWFGLYPRSLHGLFGIIFCPFLHANFNHLFFNLIPFYILANFILVQGRQTFYCVTATIVLLSGLTTWLIGRRAIHIGLSGVVMGYWGYLLMNVYHQGTLLAIMLGVVCIYYFGALLFELIPTEFNKSWESHIFGFLSGLAAVYVCPMF